MKPSPGWSTVIQGDKRMWLPVCQWLLSFIIYIAALKLMLESVTCLGSDKVLEGGWLEIFVVTLLAAGSFYIAFEFYPGCSAYLS